MRAVALTSGLAAVGRDDLAGHEGRGIGGEEDDRAGNLVGLADPAERHA
jgi:hypothetical protein